MAGLRGFVAALAGAAVLAGCTASGTWGVVVTGTVDDTTDAVSVPILAAAVVDVNAGFASDAGNATSGTSVTDAGTILGLGTTVRIAAVKVREGDKVAAGQVVATLDQSTLKVELQVAKADQAAAKAQVDVLGSAIESTYDKAKDVADAKKKVDDAIAKATKLQTKLAKALKELKAARPQLVAKLTAAENLLAHYPPNPPAGTPSQAELQAAITRLKAAIKKVDANIAKITTARPKLTAGLKKAHQARKKLDDAGDKISDARAALKDAKELAEIGAEASGIPVELAQVQLGLTELAAPAAGVVTYAATAGDQLAPGASVVEVRPDGPSAITAWLSPAQAAQVCAGDAARIAGDWMPAGTAVDGSLTWLGTQYTYPPTDVTTDEIHLTRALEVRVTATSTQLPAGVPVDITITGCRPAAQTGTNG